jgi:protein O-GlcNAc transferase
MTNFNHEFQAAQQNYKAGNYQHAGAICSNILKVNPTHPESLLLTGMVLNKLKNHTGALQFLERAAIFHPAKYAILAEKAISNIGLYKYDEAEYLLAESIRLNPKYEKSQIQLAICKKRKKDAHSAEEILLNWLTIKPNSVSALNNLANLYTEQNKMQEAEIYFQKTLEVDPNNAKAIINMGYCQQLRGKIDEAEELYRKGLKIAPTDSFGIAKLALLTSQKGETDKALAILNSATKHNIIDPFILNAFGNIFIQTGEIARAKNAYLESLKMNPDKAETLTLLGQVYNSLSHFNKAEEALTKSIELNPWVDTPKIELCSTYQFLNKEEEAFNLLTELHEKLPDNKDVFFALARLVCDLCEWENRSAMEKKFIENVETIVKVDTEYPFKVFNFNYFNIPIDLQLEASKQLARFFSKQVEAIKKRVSFTHNWPRHQRIRLGYISPDFRSHPIGQVIYHLFQYHNRNEFEVYAYSLFTRRVAKIVSAIKSKPMLTIFPTSQK